MASITARPTQDRKHKDRDRPQKSRALPPPVTIARRGENLDRRIRNLESLGDGVFIGNVLASYMALPGLVGFWPMSSVQRSTGNAYDLSGQGRTLTRNGNPAYTFFNGLVPYIDLDGTGDFLSRADETDLDILGDGEGGVFTNPGAAGLTMGGWYWIDTTGADRIFASKFNVTGNQRSYIIYRDEVATVYRFIVSSDGTATTSVDSSVATATGTWIFAVGRFTPSTEIAVFINSTKDINTTSIPASIFASTAGFLIGAASAGAVLLDGRAALVFLCANSLGDDLISSLFSTSRILFEV